jgi:hypothetical protein
VPGLATDARPRLSPASLNVLRVPIPYALARAAAPNLVILRPSSLGLRISLRFQRRAHHYRIIPISEIRIRIYMCYLMHMLLSAKFLLRPPKTTMRLAGRSLYSSGSFVPADPVGLPADTPS